MRNSYQILINKLQHFIKRYYMFEIMKGFFISFALIFIFLITESLIEYYNYTSVVFRTFLFYATLNFFLLILVYYIFRPLFALFKIGLRLNYKQAAFIISNHFPEIKDKLINTLELGQNLSSETDNELLVASIEQRTQFLNPLPFKIALPFKTVKKSFYYFAFSLLVILGILSFAPSIVINGSSRIINYNTHYEKPAPFTFNFVNYPKFIKKGSVLSVNLLINGDYIPDKVYISISNNTFLMKKDDKQKNLFLFEIKNLNNDINVSFTADDFISKNFSIKVLSAPILKDFFVEILPPSYTELNKFSQKNSGDLNIPFGSVVKWKFISNYTDSVFLIFDTISAVCNKSETDFTFKKQFFKSTNYSLIVLNKHFKDTLDLKYQLNVIPDLYPEISVQIIADSLHFASFYYISHIEDDYGFKSLTFNYRILSATDSTNIKSIPVKIPLYSKNQDVFYYFDFSKIDLHSSDALIEYYFEVFDNDYISSYKSVKSSKMIYKPFSRKQQRDKIEEYVKSNENNIQKSKKLIAEINKEINDFKKKELNSNLTEWDKKNFIKNINKKQNELNSLLDKIKEQNARKNSLDKQLYKNNEELLKKQKEIQKILDELFDDELKQLLKELDELRNKFDDKKFENLKNKIDLSYKDLDKNLDKSLELLKRYQVEENVQHLSEDLDKLSKRQEQLADKNFKKQEREQLKIEQNSIKNSLNILKKDFEKTQKKNSELKRPYQMQNFEKDFEKIQNKLQDIQNNIDKKSSKKTKQEQKKVGEEMKKLSQKMQDMLNEMNSMSMNMNMEDLRQLIDNLNTFSLNQEKLYKLLQPTYANDPLYNDLMKKQNKLKLDFSIINDSLNSLAERLVQLNTLISDKVKNINYSIQTCLSEFENLHRRAVMRQERSIINSANILALVLDELNDQLKKQQSQGGSGKGKKQSESMSMQKLKQQQKNLKQQLEQLLEELKKNGGKKEGGNVNKQIVKSLAEQEVFNKMLKDLQNSEGISPDGVQKLKQIKKLSDDNINDLINKNISPELIKRTETIKTRLLEAEKAERKREQDKIRESKEGNNIERQFPEEIKKFLKKQLKYKETLQKTNLNLNLFYKNLSKEYYQRIK